MIRDVVPSKCENFGCTYPLLKEKSPDLTAGTVVMDHSLATVSQHYRAKTSCSDEFPDGDLRYCSG